VTAFDEAAAAIESLPAMLRALFAPVGAAMPAIGPEPGSEVFEE
jgi:hypothetical protein